MFDTSREGWKRLYEKYPTLGAAAEERSRATKELDNFENNLPKTGCRTKILRDERCRLLIAQSDAGEAFSVIRREVFAIEEAAATK